MGKMEKIDEEIAGIQRIRKAANQILKKIKSVDTSNTIFS
jgi:hypothetical protein